MANSIVLFLDLVLALAVIVGFIVAVHRLGLIVSLLQALNSSWGEYRESGFGGQISQERIENLLPGSVACPSCREQLDLTFGERLFRRFKCPECGKVSDLNAAATQG